MKRFILALVRRFNFLFPDKLYLKVCFYLEMDTTLNLKVPQTFNEKLQWLKLYNRKPEYTMMVDKILVKEYIADIIGREYVVPILGVWDNPDEIDYDSLPDKFVLKTNHSGGNTGVVIVKDKAKIDKEFVRRKLQTSLKSDIYKRYREWPYKNVKKKIFAETYLGDELIDYKFSCFDGYVDSVMICLDRQLGDPKFYFFDSQWNLRRYNKRGINAPKDFTIPKPEKIDDMFDLASKISRNFPYSRIDLYNINGKIYFGEITFFPASGFDANLLPETDEYFGSLINLK